MDKLKVILFGSTGMVGQGVLKECLRSDQVESVLAINRTSFNLKHPKVTEILHTDFFQWQSITTEMTGYNTCFFCLGVTSVGLSEEKYHHLTYDLTLGVAEILAMVNPKMTFCYISGQGTDSTEQGRVAWARVKGKTENSLLRLPFKQVLNFRPGYIQPMDGIRSKTRIYNLAYDLFGWLWFLLKHLKGSVTDTRTLGRAMIAAVQKEEVPTILETSYINLIGRNG